MLKIRTKFRCVIAAYMCIPIAGMILAVHGTPMFHTHEFQGVLGISVAAVILLGLCSPLLFGLRWILLSQLGEISSAISRIKTGNYTYFILPNEPSETGDENEVVALMRDMNWMIRQIEYRETELEDRVAQRTRELEKINEELVQARDAAHASARAKSQFLATMSHEIRTPMNAIIGMSDLALKTNGDPAQKEHLSVINTASKSLLNIINDILDFSKMDAGKLVLEQIPLRIRDLMDEAADLFRAQVREFPVEFILDIDPRVPDTVTGDPLRLRQVVINLLSNAFKFTREGEVCLAVRPEPGHRLRFSVTDTGLGMNEKTRQGLFAAFTQADGSTTRKFGGTGLGLAISRQLIRLMGSDIEVDSAPDRGSCFSFVLDLPADPEAARLPAALPDTYSGRQVLVAVAHGTSRKIITGFLSDFGLVPLAMDPQAPVLPDRQIRNSILAVIDTGLADPGQLVRILTRRRSLPVIALGNARAESGDAVPDWADRLLLKPVKQSLLFDSIMELCQPKGVLSSFEALPQGTPGQVPPAILLVEDNRMNQKVAREILGTAGIVPAVAATGQQALEILADRSFDAVLMDVQIPDLDGYAVTRKIRDRGDQVPVIGMSANALDQDRETGLDAGMDAYLTKPVDARELFRTLERFLGRPLHCDAVPETGSLPRCLPGIDQAGALARLRGDEALLTRLIREFANNQAGLIETLTGLAETGDPEGLLAELHQARGNAGTIGAKPLARALADCEALVKSLPKLQVSPDLTQALQQCGRALAPVLESAAMVGRSPAPPDDPGGSSHLPSPDRMKEMKALLDQNSLKAKEFAREIAQYFAGTPLQAEAALLRTQTGRFDFTSARKTFDRLQEGMGALTAT